MRKAIKPLKKRFAEWLILPADLLIEAVFRRATVNNMMVQENGQWVPQKRRTAWWNRKLPRSLKLSGELRLEEKINEGGA
jgi:hypothetical protein